VFSISVYKSISQLRDLVGRVREQEASVKDVDLHIAAVKQTLTPIREAIGADLTGAFCSFSQHLRFLRYYYQRNEPDRYESDLNDPCKARTLQGSFKL
jgi:hypothetical protein